MDEREVNSEEKLEDVMDMDKVKENENTALGKTTMSVGRDAATRTSDKIDIVDNATKTVAEGVKEMEREEQDKNNDSKGKDEENTK